MDKIINTKKMEKNLYYNLSPKRTSTIVLIQYFFLSEQFWGAWELGRTDGGVEDLKRNPVYHFSISRRFKSGMVWIEGTGSTFLVFMILNNDNGIKYYYTHKENHCLDRYFMLEI